MVGGRPLELTESIITEAGKLISRALYVETVAASLGVHRDTFYDWLKKGARERRRRDRGKEADPALDLHVRFSDTIKKRIADTEIDLVSQIQAAGLESWQAMAWLLERRFIGKWSLNRAEVRELKKRLDELEKGSNGLAGQTQTPNRAGAKAGR